MALTLAKVVKTVVGNKRLHVMDVTFDSSYPTNGEAVTAGTFGLARLDSLQVHSHATRIVTHDATNSKLKVHTALGTEAANASDQSTITVRVTAIGN